MQIRHPPGRGGRLWLADRLATADRAEKLLTQKERVLTREQRRLIVLERAARREWETVWREHQTWIARAVMLRGRRVVPLATPTVTASVEVTWRNSMGAYYPSVAACRLPPLLPAAQLAGTAAMSEATDSGRRGLELGVQHAAARRALDEVERELRASRRRARMLKHQLIPALMDALHRVEFELEERERDDVVYARRAQTDVAR